MFPPAAVKPSHHPAKWTPWPYCSHPTHLLYLHLSSSSSPPLPPLSSCNKWALWIHSGPQIKYYIVIFHLHSVSSFISIPLTLSFSNLSSFPSICAEAPLSLSMPLSDVLKDVSQGVGTFFSPLLRYNLIRWAQGIRFQSHMWHFCSWVQFLISEVLFVAWVSHMRP